MVEAKLQVPRAELLKALQTISKFTRTSSKDEALLRFSETVLEFSVNGIASGVPAEGSWNGEARVPAAFLVRIGRSLPKDDPFEVFIRNGRCYFGPLSVTCTWQAASDKHIELPMDAPLAMILALRQSHSAAAIERSGLMKTLAEAEEKRDAIIRRAAELLVPLAVEQSDLERLVIEAIRRHSQIA